MSLTTYQISHRNDLGLFQYPGSIIKYLLKMWPKWLYGTSVFIIGPLSYSVAEASAYNHFLKFVKTLLFPFNTIPYEEA